MASKPSISGLDPLKELFESILLRLEALEVKVGGGATPGGSLLGGSSHGKPLLVSAKSNKRLSIVHGECSCGLVQLGGCFDDCPSIIHCHIWRWVYGSP